jgi:hypothetical protein
MFNETGAVGSQCNEFFFGKYNSPPWPENCREYHTNEFDIYEISKDGKSVDSCSVTTDEVNIPDLNNTNYPKCVEYYENEWMFETKKKVKLLFPDTGE